MLSIDSIEDELKNLHNVNLESLANSLGTYPNAIKRLYLKKGYSFDLLKEKLDSNCSEFVKNVIIKNNNNHLTNDELYKLVSKYCNRLMFMQYLKDCFENDLLQKPLCKFCNKEHNRFYGNGIFCSSQCSHSFSQSFITEDGKIKRNEMLIRSARLQKYTKREGKPHTKESREKISNALKKHYVNNPDSRKHISENLRKRKCTPETRKKLSNITKKRVAEGKHQGWASRSNPSYPEIIWSKILEDNHVVFEHEVPINKKKHLGLDESSNYFLDFLIIGKDCLIDLEIDGKQHNYPKQEQSDIIRDIALRSNGFTVVRLPWVNPKNNKNEFNRQKEWLLNYLSKNL